MTNTVRAELPAATISVLVDWPDSPIVATFPRDVAVLHGHVHGPHGVMNSAAAVELATALIAAAWWAGYRPQGTTGEVIAIPAPTTLDWGDPDWLYFAHGRGHVAADPGQSNVELGSGERLDCASAWAEGLSLLAAGRHVYTATEAAA